MENTTVSPTQTALPKFDLGALRHVARITPAPGPIHLEPKTLADLNAEMNSLDMGHMEFMKYEGKEDPHLDAFMAEQSGGESGGELP